jgi:splicing factor U2AF 35 kDa subunit
MAEHLAQIFGTEKDKINCPFYYKIGACRHGERCSRTHNKPLFSQTLLFTNLYVSPTQIAEQAKGLGIKVPLISEDDAESYFEEFYADIHGEMTRFGVVEGMAVCENRSDHLAGNTYVKFADEESAKAALAGTTGRYYAGRPIMVEFSPVTELNDGRCRKFEEEDCERGDYCHFMHTRRLSDGLYRSLYPKRPRVGDRERDWGRDHERSVDRAHRDRDDFHDWDREITRDRERERDRGHGADGRRERDREYVHGREKHRVRDRGIDREFDESNYSKSRDLKYRRNGHDPDARRSPGGTKRDDGEQNEGRREYDREHRNRHSSHRSARGMDSDRYRERR